MTSPNASNGAAVNMTEAILGPSLARGQEQDTAIYFGEETVTFGALNQRTNQTGNALRALGVSQGDRVLLMIKDSPNFLYVHLGTMKIGAVAIALNLRLSGGDLKYTIEDSEASILVIDEMFLPVYEEIASSLSHPVKVIVADKKMSGYDHLADLIEGASDELEAAATSPDDPAFWCYSSGTTGTPKGVVHHHRMILGVNHLFGEMFGIGPGDRVYGSSKLFFAYSLGHVYLASLTRGASVILFPDWPDADAVAEVVEKYRPTVLLSVPTFYRNLMRGGVASNEAFKQVRYYISAGEKLPTALFDLWLEATGQPIYEGIGATETINLFLANGPGSVKAGTCGKITPGTEVKLVGENGEIVAEPNSSGVLWTRMVSIAGSYWKLPEKSSEVFQDGWYCTNDSFMFDEEGWYEYQGRADDMLKISGQWVSPTEIEDHVLRHEKVSEAAVVGVANEDGLVRLVMFMVSPEPEENRQDLEKEVQDSLVAALSIYKCPRRIIFVEAMPTTATGKLQRHALRELAAG